MSVKHLISAGHPILNEPAQPVTEFNQEVEELLLDLEDTMYDVGASAICAQQIGISKQVAIIDMEQDGLLQLINPSIIRTSEQVLNELEGSISKPDVYGYVLRPQMIVLKSNDKRGREVEMTACDDIARMILHMVDHFNGIWFTDLIERELTETEMEAYFEDE
ncbi:peptide deformylase [Staphylococcus sp. SQ8-PEA]|uniref:Peptide deformylase-like n=1 Tax=Staphylococcus marylandisciuri TaxID=2981529 RepID=A0ABT2QP34_9STAP|nr:peptide deformylase [Staphylococcus marylandisciuri]MCU5745746.1 peptide deformylase [Staphylococcus marylandisciuri]